MNGKRLIITLWLLLCVVGLWGCSGPSVSTGWETTDAGTLYLDAQGNPVTGWLEIDGKRYYFGEDGIMVTGWLRLDGENHFFDDSGAKVTGWVESQGMRYYLTDTGPLTGWQEIDGRRYYFRETGPLLTGWAEFSGSRYYFDENGQPLTGWQDIENSRYHFSEEGVMTLGWYSEGEYDYYFKSSGVMAVGPTEIDGETRYFSPHGVHIWLTNPWNPVSPNYSLDLVDIEGGYQMDAICYDALVRMLSDCRAAGYNPWIVSGYRTHDVQVHLFEVKVEFYLDQDYTREEAEIEAAKSIAVPGTSEHQLGLAIDILDAEYNRMDDTQADTPTQQWLMAHCHEYGFILRYEADTTDITGIIYEPWHYRYVGVEIANEIVELGVTLEEYLNAVVTQ